MKGDSEWFKYNKARPVGAALDSRTAAACCRSPNGSIDFLAFGCE